MSVISGDSGIWSPCSEADTVTVKVAADNGHLPSLTVINNCSVAKDSAKKMIKNDTLEL